MGEMGCKSSRHWSYFHLTLNTVFVLHSLPSQHPPLQLSSYNTLTQIIGTALRPDPVLSASQIQLI